MLALSSSLFSTFGWLLEESLTSHETADNNHQSLLDDQYYLPLPSAAHPLHAFTSCGNGDQVPNKSNKKLNHNANERHRRKKINGLYSSLQALLPSDDRKKKLSVPATVARVIKYIPELQQEVERLVQKKEDLWARVSGHHDQQKQLRRKFDHSSSFAISTAKIGDTEITIQISTSKLHGNPLLMSHIIHSLEEDDTMILIDVSSFESLGGIIFYNLYLQVERSYELEREVLSEKILSLHEKEMDLFP